MSYRKKHIHPKIKGLKKKKRIFTSPVFWLSVLLLIIIIFIFYFVLFFPKLQVKNIEISGNEKINSQDIENLAWPDLERKILNARFFNISSKSILVVDAGNLVKDILNKFPEIENVEVQKKLFDKIILKIKERKVFAVFCQQTDPSFDKCFSIDENGIIFKPLQKPESNMIVLSRPSENREVLVGENVIDKNIINMIYKVQNSLKNNFQIDVKEAFVSNPLVFKTSENWQIYFDGNSDIDLQITKMNMLLKDEITANKRKNLQYIYLQYKDRAYYK